jgi:hypothetical protein
MEGIEYIKRPPHISLITRNKIFDHTTSINLTRKDNEKKKGKRRYNV